MKLHKAEYTHEYTQEVKCLCGRITHEWDIIVAW